MESEEGNRKNMMTNSPPSVQKVDHHTSSKTSNPSSSISSSPDSTLDDPTRNLDKNSEKPISTNSVSKYELSENGALCATSPVAFTGQVSNLTPANVSATQSPSPQVMEHPTGLTGPSSYRIPSSVFARSKSSTPMEWSVCSNESLFSIHMGNMSFRNDPLFLRSGELGLPGEVSSFSQMFNYSPVQPPGSKATGSKSVDLGMAEASMKEVIRESEYQKNERWMSEECMSRHSRESGTSAKSFAFPM
ncbi:uncharacterized protein Fot_48172 [Forsythia ovata]|uniref:Uncharacterized protein n=1 Tax=Forsythia ovata TaxID=205694 RepID=A0ABD1QSM1_9LAMI